MCFGAALDEPIANRFDCLLAIHFILVVRQRINRGAADGEARDQQDLYSAKRKASRFVGVRLLQILPEPLRLRGLMGRLDRQFFHILRHG